MLLKTIQIQQFVCLLYPQTFCAGLNFNSLSRTVHVKFVLGIKRNILRNIITPFQV